MLSKFSVNISDFFFLLQITPTLFLRLETGHRFLTRQRKPLKLWSLISRWEWKHSFMLFIIFGPLRGLSPVSLYRLQKAHSEEDEVYPEQGTHFEPLSQSQWDSLTEDNAHWDKDGIAEQETWPQKGQLEERGGVGGGTSGCSQHTFHFVAAHTSAKPKEMLLSCFFLLKCSLNDKVHDHIGFYPGAVIRASLKGP